MDFTVSEVSTSDLPHLLASVRELFREDAGKHDPLTDTSWPEHSGAAYYSPLIEDDDSLCLLAFSGDAAAGHLIGRIRSGDPLRPGVVTAVLESLRVAPEFRRGGAASALVSRFLAWAADRHADQLKVTAYAANEAAVAFYRGHGFVPFELTLRRL